MRLLIGKKKRKGEAIWVVKLLICVSKTQFQSEHPTV